MIPRDLVLEALVPYFEADERRILLVCDCGFAKIDAIKQAFPERVINCGVMEQATVGIASGMARGGMKPIVYSIAVFLAFRALEQIRNDIVLAKQDVRLIGNGSGDYFKSMGDCHWCKDDDKRLMEVIGMPVFTDFNEWINTTEAGYLKC